MCRWLTSSLEPRLLVNLQVFPDTDAPSSAGVGRGAASARHADTHPGTADAGRACLLPGPLPLLIPMPPSCLDGEPKPSGPGVQRAPELASTEWSLPSSQQAGWVLAEPRRQKG